MDTARNKNAVKALIAEYKRTIWELQSVIQDLSDSDLAFVLYPESQNPDGFSIQTILAHVVRSGYSYCIYIRSLKHHDMERPEKILRGSAAAFIADLDEVMVFTEETFLDIYDDALEEFDEAKKMKTSWEQTYDIEQLMEHAIVHVLRHRRQIENFKTALLKIV